MAKGKYQKWLEPDNLILLKGWARDGKTDEELAELMDVSRATIYDWKNKYPDISDALKKGKEIIDIEVENALLKRALGFEYPERKYIMEKMSREEYDEVIDIELEVWNEQNPKATNAERRRFIRSISEYKEVLVETKVKTVPPDTTAQIFWLKNRKPHEWRDKQQIEHSGETTTNHNLMAGLSLEELRAIAKTDD